jgi:hypothetical protein
MGMVTGMDMDMVMVAVARVIASMDTNIIQMIQEKKLVFLHE